MKNEVSQEVVEIGSLIQKIGKTKRKYEIKMPKHIKRIIIKIVSEMRVSISTEGGYFKNFVEFSEYLDSFKKSKENISFSFDEIEFLRKLILLTLKHQQETVYKWYNFIGKLFSKIAIRQYKEIISILNI